MKPLFWNVGRLFGAKRKVKLLGLFLLIFSAQSQAQTKVAYGPYIVAQAVLWLPDYLDGALLNLGYVNHLQPPDQAYQFVQPQSRRTVDLLKAVYDLATEFRHDNYSAKNFISKDSPFLQTQLSASGRVKFRAGGDKIFELKKGERPRMAVTGTALDSDVIFNLGLIGEAKFFSFADALALWIHELGHKISAEKFSQEEIDAAAGLIGRGYASQMQIYKIAGLDVLVLNPVPYAKEGESMVGPFSAMPQRRASLFAIVQGDEFADFTESLNLQLDRFGYQSSNKLEIKRPILSVVKLKESAREIELRLEMRTARFPKNLNHYVSDEVGPNYHKSARVILSRDLKTLSVSHYVDEPLPRPMIMDAEAEIFAPAISQDKKELKATLLLHLKNQTHFHAAGYPEDYFTLHALLDGEPVRLEARIRYSLSTLNTGMPAEVYKKEFTKEGRISVDISELHGKELEIIGLQDRFFTLGASWIGPDQDQMRVRLRATLPIYLPAAGCEPDLKL